MKKLLMLLALSIFLFLALASASTCRQYESCLISQPIRIDGATSTSIVANVTIKDPNNIVLVTFAPMTNNATVQEHQYWLSSSLTSKTGTYEYCITALGTGLNNTECFNDLEINPTGSVQTSILENPVLLIFGIFALVFLLLGVYLANPYLGFISGILFMVGGVYTMIYGFNNVTDLYTRGIATTFLGIGLLFSIYSSYEWWIEGGLESEDD